MYRWFPFALTVFAFSFWVIFPSRVSSQQLLADWQMSEYDKAQSLLSDASTAEKLAITPTQAAALRTLRDVDWRAIPAVSNLLVQSTRNPSSRHRLLAEADRTASEYKLNQTATILTPAQWNALQGLLLKGKGLSVALQSKDIRAKLGVTDDQLNQMQHIAAGYDPLIDGLNQRLGRQKIAGLRPDEDMVEREREVECIEHVMRALQTDADRDLRAILTDNQRHQWEILIGAETLRE